MDVSAELYEATINGLRGDAVKKGVQNRKSPRVGLKGILKFWPVEREKGSKPLEVRARDVSASGISVLGASPMPPGTRYTFSLPYLKEKSREPLSFLCTVRHCQPLPGHTYVVGLKFEEREALAEGVDPSEVSRIRGAILE